MNEIAAIIDDVKQRGDAALNDWSLRLDGVEPAPATPATDFPRAALVALGEAVARWHEVQRPRRSGSRLLRVSSSSDGGTLSHRWGSTFLVG